jgi:4-amino-4-deoxy-L-arabinose transferase-like glycosyltransferase
MSVSWESSSAGAPTAPLGRTARRGRRASGADGRTSQASARALAARLPRPELAALLALAGALNLWALSRNGWANDYYSAAVRSMSSSWHDFLFASMDPSGVMTVDKPPLALWVQALSVRVFGYHSLSVLVPQALMGMASVALVYDLVRRRFGRLGGFVAGLVLATTPIAVAVWRHNNPDALLALCSVAALWCAVRALEDGRTRWLVLAGACVGLGFETKMGVALTVVPGIAAAWLWIDPRGRGRLRALRQLLGGSSAMLLLGGAWPLLVELTPAADRPWVAGTSDNTVLSLIFGYNGLNRVGGQAGVPAGVGGNLSGGSSGPLRLLNSALGGQAGWLLGFVVVSCLGMLVASRLRRSDPRTGWLIVVASAFLLTAALFSAASGIFHPYYVSLLAPFAAALAGAGAAELARGGLAGRILGPLAVAAGVACELVVVSRYPGQLRWLAPVVIPVGAVAALVLGVFVAQRARLVALAAVLVALLLAPAVWSVDTLGYATSGTFPSGGPASAALSARPRALGGPFTRPGGPARLPGGPPLFGASGAPGAGSGGPPPPGALSAAPAGPPAAQPPGLSRRGGPFALGGGPGPAGGSFGDGRSIDTVLGYVRGHGGGTIAVASQSSAAAAIIAENADVAGIGGFSGRESEVSISWLAQEVGSGKIRWVLAEPTIGFGGAPGDSRVGAKPAMAAVARACPKVRQFVTAGAFRGAAKLAITLYDCGGRAAELRATAGMTSS